MRVVVIGKSGQLAQCLAATAPSGVELNCLGRQECDITDSANAFEALTSRNPDILINASAYTAVDKAESNRDAAFALNENGPAALAGFAARRGIPLIHVSTDYVFDGSSLRPYTEEDPVAPLNVYGASKLAGELAISRIWHNHIIVRTSWLFSAWGSNFVKKMLELGRKSHTLRVVADQYGRPTSAHELANVIWRIGTSIGLDCARSERWGIYHYADAGETNWADFAAAIFASPHVELARLPEIHRIGTADYPTPARRPRHSVLDCTKIETAFGIRPKRWAASLNDVLEKIHSRIPMA